MALTIPRTKGLSLVVVWMLAASILTGVASLFAAPAVAQNCDRSGPPTAGDWNIVAGDNQVCDGIEIVMDGNLNIQGSLTVRNGGGIKFTEDTTHVYGISVTGGGDLILEDSTIWTETFLVSPYLKLTVTVSGAGSSLTMTRSTFAFPGSITVTNTGAGGATISDNSLITSTTADVAAIFGQGTPSTDDNDDSASLTIDSATVAIYASRVEKLYENTTGGAATGIVLQGSASLTAVDTYLGIDFATGVGTHNTLGLSGTSRAFLYGVTTDTSESQTQVSAIETAAGTTAYLYRFADVRVVDSRGVPVNGADINAVFSGPESGDAYFPDNANLLYPPPGVLAYLGGKTSATWDDTDASGTARMPLLSDWVDPTTQPNSRFVGTFTLDATFGLNTGSSSLTFSSYPAMDDATAETSVLITLATLQLPLPDLVPSGATWVPANPLQGDNVTITATVANTGGGGAADVLVWVSDGSTRLTEQVVAFIDAGASANVVASLPNAAPGPHAIRVSVDPNSTIIEGPTASAETNNEGTFPLSVTPLGPDLAVGVSFDPDPGFLNNPVTVRATVSNIGDGNATSVRVDFYQQETEPTASDAPFATVTLPFVDTTNPAVATVDWIPTSLGTFTFWAWVDRFDAWPEPLPYENVVNNKGSKAIVVGPAPDLVVFPQDLTMTDPFPRAGTSGTIEALVRNAGQSNAGAFRVDFFVDGQLQGSVPVGGLVSGARLPVSLSGVTLSPCGSHSIEVLVDALDVVQEGRLYEENNRATRSIQVYTSDPAQLVTWTSGTIDADQAIARNIEVNGDVTISGARISVVQDQDLCGRYYIKVVAPAGHLRLVDAELTSNWPLTVFVANGRQLTATNSTFTLDVQGKGVLYSKGTLTVTDSTIVGDVVAKGTRADLVGDTFRGSLLHIDGTATSRIWDATLPGVQTVQLASDSAVVGALDFDIRNVTFNAALTNQLVFAGDQYAQLTSVGLSKLGDWWTGMLTQSAHIRRYWWLTVQAVDGTGTLIQDNATIIAIDRFSATGPTPGWQPAPTCAVDDCYYHTNTTWYVGTVRGVLLYRAAAEDRYGDQAPLVQAAYRMTGAAFIEGTWRPPSPDRYESALVTADTAVDLRFTDLTPNLNVTGIQFNGDNGANVNEQPIGRELSIVATVRNGGQIVSRDVAVYCYATDVDVNGDGQMDNTHAFYVSAQLYIPDTDGPKNVQPQSSTTFTCRWTPPGTLEGSRTISVVVDPFNAKAELNESDNIGTRNLVVFTWPDLRLASDPVVAFQPPTPIANNTLTLTVEVSNHGTNTASNAVLGLYANPADPIGSALDAATVTLNPGASTQRDLTAIPLAPGTQRIYIRVDSAGAPQPGTYRNYDFNGTDNLRFKDFEVQTQPELSIAPGVEVSPATPFRSQAFWVNVTVLNTGDTSAQDIVVAAREMSTPTNVRGVVYGVDVPAQGQVAVSIRITVPLDASGTLNVTADYNGTVVEPDELNNWILVPITVQAPQGQIFLDSPRGGQTFGPGDTISLFGYVVQSGTGTRLGGVNVTGKLLNAANETVVSRSRLSSTSDGSFIIALIIPENLPDGTYRVAADAADVSIGDRYVTVSIATPCGFLDCAVLGLPTWIWLIVIIGVAVGIGGGTAYVKFVGLGKLVECGECGSFIPEDSAKCPKCGVEFEKDMAKCSNCQAWIPVDVKQCPECGVEFATGEVEMADYEAQMRRQYDEVKRKFREEASRELGRAISDREFEDWWRRQPTFVTFEDWLREEEDMRRMGSRPCPVCNTLNSVTATVCHKCGTLLKEEPRKPGGGRPPAAAAPAPARPAATPARAPTGAPEEIPEGGPSEAIPKKVIKKPIIGAPVVQKKVIKRPLEEGEGGTGTGSDEGEQI